MKILKLNSFKYSLAAVVMLLVMITSCQKDKDETPVVAEVSVTQALENDQDADEFMQLAQLNATTIIGALRAQGITPEEFKNLYENSDEAEIAATLKLDASVFEERNARLEVLSQTLNSRYPTIGELANDGSTPADPVTSVSNILDGNGKLSCSGWRNWRNKAKYYACSAGCSAVTGGFWAALLCKSACWYAFCR